MTRLVELREHGVDVLELVLGVTRTPAMERVGLQLDVPGFEAADPEDVAREGLAHLTNGPVRQIGDDQQKSRADVVLGTHRMMQKLFGEKEQP